MSVARDTAYPRTSGAREALSHSSPSRSSHSRSSHSRSNHSRSNHSRSNHSRSNHSRQEGRRRLLAVGSVLLVVLTGLLVNWGPYHDYRASQETLHAMQEETAHLRGEVDASEARVARLKKDGYMEALARKELTYARPGEEVYIVKGLTPDMPQGTGEVSSAPGPVEKFILLLRNLL